MPKRLSLLVFKVSLSVTLFLLLFHPEWFGFSSDLFNHVSPGQVLAEIRSAGASHITFWLAFAALARLGGMLAGVLRWRVLLRGQGLRIPFWYMVRSWFVGRYFGLYLPGTLGLDGYRLLDSSLYTGEVIKCTTVIAIEKLIGFIALTFLVFLTFPLGFRLLKINWILFAAVLLVLAVFVAVSFLLLLNPRVIQVLAAVIPTPGPLRSKVNKLGAAVTVYSGSRADLLLAVFFGLLVHVGTCFMYFGTMMAIRAPHTSLSDILFASPLLIYGTVLAPVMGGMGVRELVFVTLLGGTSGQASALTFANLGWWVGELAPYLVGWVLFVFRPVRTKEETKAKWAELRQQARHADVSLNLDTKEVRRYRGQLVDYALIGALAGLVAGALVGLAEAKWLANQSSDFTELGILCWGPLAYGLIFAMLGIGVAACGAFVSLLFDRFLSRAWIFAWFFGILLGLGTLGIGGFRYYRDVLLKHMLSGPQFAALIGISAAIGLTATLVSGLALSRFKGSRWRAALASALVYLLIISSGGVMAAMTPLHSIVLPFHPKHKSSGPDIIFIGIDTLRADYLNIFSPSAKAKTPNLDAFAKDSVVFTKCFAQASWTKPSFATMFTGLYPSTSTVTSQDSVIPNTITTLADALLAGGYYTQGYSNNANISRVWNFQKGFVDYEDLQPNTHFGAPMSAVNMTLYQGLRKARSRLVKKLVVTDFYQPAPVVTATALKWLDSPARPKHGPFYLFIHYMDCHDPYFDHNHPGVAYARAAMENPDPVKYRVLFEKAYISEIEYLDGYLGVLFDGLRKRGLYKNSVIVITGDHGEEFYEHHGWWHGDTLYDEEIHVPLLIKLPGNHPGRNGHFARHVDLAPTLLFLAGLPKVPAMQGISLFSKSDLQPNAATTSVYSEVNFEGNDVQSVRTAGHKLIHANKGNPRGLKPIELYDLKKDPGEQHNLAGTGLPQQVLLGQQMDKMRKYLKGKAPEPVYKKQIPQQIEENLRGLGYL